jgi:hypothetical protein
MAPFAKFQTQLNQKTTEIQYKPVQIKEKLFQYGNDFFYGILKRGKMERKDMIEKYFQYKSK